MVGAKFGIGLLAAAAMAWTACAQVPRLNQWTVVGPGGGGTTIGPVVSPHDPRTVVEHCDMTGGYITHDDGASWRMFNLRGGLTTFAFDPVKQGVIYAGNAALWRSVDGGRTWSMLFPSPARHTVEHQLGDHSDYALTSAETAYPGGDVSAIALDPADSSRLYVAFEKRGVKAAIVTSGDGGSTWHTLATLPERVGLLAPEHGGGVLALSGSTAVQVDGNGAVQRRASFAGQVKSSSMGRGTHDGLWLYATNMHGRVFVSRDAGRTWQDETPSLGQSSGGFEAIGASEFHPQTAYVGFRNLQVGAGDEHRYNGIARTEDGGRTWKIVFEESTRPASNLVATWVEQRARQDDETIWFDSPYSLGVAPNNSAVVYATDLFRTYRSLDNGAHWKEVNSAPVRKSFWRSRGLDVTTDYGVQFDPFDVRHVFIDYTDMGLWQSRDAGRTWEGSSQGVPNDWRNTTYWLAFDPKVRNLMWGGFSGVHDLPRPKMWRNRSPLAFTGGVAVSTDGGEHWKPSGTGMPSTSVTHILMDPSSPVDHRVLYACAFGRGVYKSTDGGKSWTLKNAGIKEKEPFAWRLTRSADGVTLYLVVARRSEGLQEDPNGDGALYRSTDGAEHWERMQLPSGVNGPTALEIDPATPARLYLTAWGREGTGVDHGGGLYASEDGGGSWHALFTKSQHVYDVTIDPQHPAVMYLCGFDAAAWRSTDAGQHWTQIRGYNFKWGHRVILDPVNPKMIYITTYGGGVWHGPAAGSMEGTDDVQTVVPVAE